MDFLIDARNQAEIDEEEAEKRQLIEELESLDPLKLKGPIFDESSDIESMKREYERLKLLRK
jgi:hypothetical protein